MTETWTCERCHRPTVVTGSELDVAAALDAVRVRHQAHDLPGTARSRREDRRAAARRRAARKTA